TSPSPSSLYTLSLHDALPIFSVGKPSKLKLYLFAPSAWTRITSTIVLRDTSSFHLPTNGSFAVQNVDAEKAPAVISMNACIDIRSEEHTSELQSRSDLVCRLL